MIFVADSLYELLRADAVGFVVLCFIAFAKWNRRRVDGLTRESVIDDVKYRMFRAWNEDDSTINSLQDLSGIAGEVLDRAEAVEDELGPWFPGRHREVPPFLFNACTFTFPVEQGVRWEPWWRTPTGAWEGYAPRQLEASSS
ncbi:MAG TPA: hypothetical protein VFR23_04690 [Jiangellaceae bacterium]|nr:hypothetical protein [Jiangellaceae bacterium]